MGELTTHVGIDHLDARLGELDAQFGGGGEHRTVSGNRWAGYGAFGASTR